MASKSSDQLEFIKIIPAVVGPIGKPKQISCTCGGSVEVLRNFGKFRGVTRNVATSI